MHFHNADVQCDGAAGCFVGACTWARGRTLRLRTSQSGRRHSASICSWQLSAWRAYSAIASHWHSSAADLMYWSCHIACSPRGTSARGTRHDGLQVCDFVGQMPNSKPALSASW